MSYGQLLWIMMGALGLILSWKYVYGPVSWSLLLVALFLITGPIGLAIGLLFRMADY